MRWKAELSLAPLTLLFACGLSESARPESRTPAPASPPPVVGPDTQNPPPPGTGAQISINGRVVP